MASPSRPPLDPSRLSVKETKGFSHLRQLLLAPEQSELERLKNRLDHYILEPSDVGRVLPDAIRLRAQQDSRLLSSMIPITQEALSLSIKQSPQLISDSIAPILGPAIRKAITRAMRGMVQSLNQTLEYSMSWKGLQWRWEAFRTGKSFAEVVLLHTLRFRVEQVFLIHKKTGILLNHVVADGISGQGEEVISGMLTAIQDFVRDSFGQKQDDSLESLRIGDLTVWIEQGSGAILAGVIRGAPPTELREVFQETLETIHAQFSELLQTFKGDVTSFEETCLPLEDCLQAQFEKKSKGLPFFFWVLIGLLLLGLGVWAVQARSNQQQWTQLLERISQEPGLVVTSVEEQGSESIFYGLRDPLARNPEQILLEAGYSPKQAVFRLKPFMDLTPEFVQRRAHRVLQPPNSADLRWETTHLSVVGHAPRAWITKANLLGPLLPGLMSFDTNGMAGTEDMERFDTLRARLEKLSVNFLVGGSALTVGEKTIISKISEAFESLDKQALLLGLNPQVQVLGFTDSRGTRDANLELSTARAENVVDALPINSFRALKIEAIGKGVSISAEIGGLPIGGRRAVIRVVRPQGNLLESPK